MTRIVGKPRDLTSAIILGAIALSGWLLSAATSETGPIQTVASTQTSASANAGKLVVLESSVKDTTVRFGEELTVLVAIQNRGATPVKIPPDALLLNNDHWRQGGGSGSGIGTVPLVRQGSDGKQEIVIQPGESELLSCSILE